MFKRRDIPPVVLLLVLLLLVVLTLSQILVVHRGRYGRNVHSMRRLQLELRELDLNLHSLMMQNVPSIELNRRMLVNQINTNRFADILRQASEAKDMGSLLKHRNNRTMDLKRDDGMNGTMEAGLVENERHSSSAQNVSNIRKSGNGSAYCPSVPPHLRK
jgi:hypothetical protein